MSISYFSLKGPRNKEMCIAFSDAGMNDGSVYVRVSNGPKPSGKEVAGAIVSGAEFAASLGAYVHAGRPKTVPGPTVRRATLSGEHDNNS
jgi:hypothetical protein